MQLNMLSATDHLIFLLVSVGGAVVGTFYLFIPERMLVPKFRPYEAFSKPLVGGRLPILFYRIMGVYFLIFAVYNAFLSTLR